MKRPSPATLPTLAEASLRPYFEPLDSYGCAAESKREEPVHQASVSKMHACSTASALALCLSLSLADSVDIHGQAAHCEVEVEMSSTSS
jgi:hypothetical protein